MIAATDTRLGRALAYVHQQDGAVPAAVEPRSRRCCLPGERWTWRPGSTGTPLT